MGHFQPILQLVSSTSTPIALALLLVLARATIRTSQPLGKS